MSIDGLITIISVAFGFIVNWWINKNKIAELKMAQRELEEKLRINAENANQNKEDHDLGLSKQFLSIAKESGEQVITRDETIKELQNVVKLLRNQVNELIDGKKILEEESSKKDLRISSLESQVNILVINKEQLESEKVIKDEEFSIMKIDNAKLRDRVQILEEVMTAAGVPLPTNGGK
jgi:hypothetical protein